MRNVEEEKVKEMHKEYSFYGLIAGIAILLIAIIYFILNIN